MIVYRTCHIKEINNRHVPGIQIPDGRWHLPGLAVWYAASSLSLCKLELASVIPPSLMSGHYMASMIYLPDDIIMQIPPQKLTERELGFPMMESTMQKGAAIAREGFMPYLKVPSALVPSESNYLIFLSHHLAEMVEVLDIQPLATANFDETKDIR